MYKPLVLMFGIVYSTVQALAQNPSDWKLSPAQAQAMISYYSGCTEGCETSKATPDAAMEATVRAAFPSAKSITWQDARYTKADVARYAQRRRLDAKAANSQVAGYTTQLLRVEDADGTEAYFDIAGICPPPALCMEPVILPPAPPPPPPPPHAKKKKKAKTRTRN